MGKTVLEFRIQLEAEHQQVDSANKIASFLALSFCQILNCVEIIYAPRFNFLVTHDQNEKRFGYVYTINGFHSDEDKDIAEKIVNCVFIRIVETVSSAYKMKEKSIPKIKLDDLIKDIMKISSGNFDNIYIDKIEKKLRSIIDVVGKYINNYKINIFRIQSQVNSMNKNVVASSV